MYLLKYCFTAASNKWWWTLHYNNECVAQSGKGYAHKRSAQAALKRIVSTSVLNKTKEVK